MDPMRMEAGINDERKYSPAILCRAVVHNLADEYLDSE